MLLLARFFMIMEEYIRSDEWKVMAEEVINEHEDLHWIKNSVRIDYVISFKEKKKSGGYVHAECKHISDFYQLYCPYDFVIVIYSNYVFQIYA